jgi:hypothetical protein
VSRDWLYLAQPIAALVFFVERLIFALGLQAKELNVAAEEPIVRRRAA